MAAVDKRVVEFYSLIILCDIDSEASHMGATQLFGVYPLPRDSLKVLLGAGFAKQSAQNLECRRLRVKIQTIKDLHSLILATCITSASTMMG
jgi:hypothetical protein